MREVPREVSRRRPASGDAAATDFDLHGRAGIRLVDATEEDTAAVERQLGPLQAQVEGRPDIVIRFVDRVETDRPLVLVGDEDAAFAGGAFLITRGRHRTRLRAALPLDRLGAGLEIVCEHGAAAVPLLVPILNVVTLSKGVLPLHAAAFVHEGVGAVVAGWSRGGKTDALLGFVDRGATYVGDDWVYVDGDGRHVWGLPEPVRVWDWQLRDSSPYRKAVPASDRLRLRCMRLARSATRVLPRTNGLRTRANALAGRHLGVEILPQRLFGAGATAADCRFDVLFLAVSHDSSAVTVEPIDPLEVAVRMAFSLQYERGSLRNAYEQFRFAFPWSASIAMERADEMERRLLRRTLAGKPAFLVRHPYPVGPDVLADAMIPYCRLQR